MRDVCLVIDGLIDDPSSSFEIKKVPMLLHKRDF